MEVYRVITYPDVRKVKLPSVLNPDIIHQILRKFGKFDLIELVPVCSMIFFIPTPKFFYPYSDAYYHCGIMMDGKIYESWGLLNTKITDIKDREQEFIQNKSVIFPYPIEARTLKREMVDGSPPIEFITRCIGATQRFFTDSGVYTGDRLFHSFTELYQFLKYKTERIAP